MVNKGISPYDYGILADYVPGDGQLAEYLDNVLSAADACAANPAYFPQLLHARALLKDWVKEYYYRSDLDMFGGE